MHWLPLALMTALTVTARDAWVKKHLSYLGPYEMAVYPFFYSMPLFAASYCFVQRPPLDPIFWKCFFAAIPFEIAAILIYMEAIRVSPLSLTIPYLAFTPAFVLLTGRILLQETPNGAGLVGIVAIVVGSYILNLNPSDRRLLAPFLSITRERGSRLMMVVAMIYSITSALGRKAILHSSPMFFAVSYSLAVALTMLLLLLACGKVSFRPLTRELTKGCVAGALFFSQVLFHNFAMASAKAVYMISVKRLSVVMSVICGGVLFKEKNIAPRLAGALLMVGGALLISLWGE